MAVRVPRPLRRFILALAVLLIVPATVAPQSPAYDSFFAFGDSLADVGNIFISSQLIGLNPPTPPSGSPHMAYFQGRFSNGPVAFEYLWEQLSGQAPGSPGGLQPSVLFPALPPQAAVSFAFGATGVGVQDPIPGGFLAPGLLDQIQLFASMLTAPPSERALYGIVTGSNEYARDSDPHDVVDAIALGIRALYGLGARNILVSTIPDLSEGPIAAASDKKALSKLSKEHNRLLKQALHDLRAELEGVNLIEFDVNDAVKKTLPRETDRITPALDVFFPPDLFPAGFRMSLCILNPVTCRDAPTFDVGLQYQFWDAFHPTTEVHRLVGEAMYETLTR
jgi:phospholipase/lecithinase/hemolysin